MEQVDVDDVEHVDHPLEINAARRPISRSLGTGDFAMVHYELEPGDGFSAGMHNHHDQEEVFYILEGTATFEVSRDHETVTVESGGAIRFDPGEFQYGYNDSDRRVVGLALAAPGVEHDWEQEKVLTECEECGEETIYSIHPLGDFSWQEEQIDFEMTCDTCGTTISLSDIRSGG